MYYNSGCRRGDHWPPVTGISRPYVNTGDCPNVNNCSLLRAINDRPYMFIIRAVRLLYNIARICILQNIQ